MRGFHTGAVQPTWYAHCEILNRFTFRTILSRARQVTRRPATVIAVHQEIQGRKGQRCAVAFPPMHKKKLGFRYRCSSIVHVFAEHSRATRPRIPDERSDVSFYDAAVARGGSTFLSGPWRDTSNQ